jgi:phytoene dehydrogenase-like protein
MGLPSAVVVVGAGLSGLTAAAELSGRGVPVLVFDDPSQRTAGLENVHFEHGPPILYELGAAVAGLRRIGVPIDGARWGPNGGFALRRGAMHTLPVGCCSLLTTGLFGPAAKLDLARFLAALPKVDVSPLHAVATSEWLRSLLSDPRALQFALALARFACCTNDPDHHSAAAAAVQLKLSLAGPALCLHEGWDTVVATLRDIAVSRGAVISTSCRVLDLNVERGVVASVAVADGETIACRAVIVACGPAKAAALLGNCLATATVPVCMATLDLALTRLPAPRATFALGVDEAVYCVAAATTLRDEGASPAVVHVAQHLTPGDRGSRPSEAALERAADLLQPGWRDLVLRRQFRPRVMVGSVLAMAASGPGGRRPGTRASTMENVFLAGDWIGPTGELADASVASALQAASAVERLVASS